MADTPVFSIERMISLGKMPNMDPDKSTEGPDAAVEVTAGKSFGSADQPLFQNMTAVTLNDTNGDGFIPSGGPETISYTTDGVSADYTVNTSFTVSNCAITIQLPDGNLYTVTQSLHVMQDSDGNVFLLPPPDNDKTTQWELDVYKYPIVSVTFSDNPGNYDPCETGIHTTPHCFPCFARGTLIETEFGSMPVEDLIEGVQVWTKDNGLQPIRWIGSRHLDSTVLAQNEAIRPIRIRAGALGANSPTQDLLVSPQHRILVRSRIALKMFGAEEILVAAKQLLQIEGIDIVEDQIEVEYFHFLFDQHEIVLSNGAETESLYTGDEALKSLGSAACEEIFQLFPELRHRTPGEVATGARLLASGRMGRKLAVRHAQNGKALVQ
ncbi:Hint domain-containing protein [Paracoccus aminophilus]|uniref:Hedgehog/Intein (Hint) domain-containing protein n=1 Tax=Paracoccus aminophilus JCM 7686 TaxID=1367847 RepID=S5YTA3_PARAH|nr:Hint domain-containing protein [Paracoccus aminophilus]AGT08456.1 hypothetical protein JCM7686_1355 [Paracoccus aminophilus JCM 7686]